MRTPKDLLKNYVHYYVFAINYHQEANKSIQEQIEALKNTFNEIHKVQPEEFQALELVRKLENLIIEIKANEYVRNKFKDRVIQLKKSYDSLLEEIKDYENEESQFGNIDLSSLNKNIVNVYNKQ